MPTFKTLRAHLASLGFACLFADPLAMVGSNLGELWANEELALSVAMYGNGAFVISGPLPDGLGELWENHYNVGDPQGFIEISLIVRPELRYQGISL